MKIPTFAELKNKLNKRPVRFVITGGLAAVTEYVSFATLIFLHSNIIIANVISFALSLVVGFTLHKLWVFKAVGESKKQATSYILLACINITISSCLIYIAVEKLAVLPLVAKLVTMVLIACSNYVLFSRIVFRSKS